VEVPVFVVVQVVDAERRSEVLVELPDHPNISREVIAHALVGVSVHV